MNGTLLGKRTMAECNVDLPSDKLCKYSFTSWCPTCDRDSPRRRTKSETYESCRRKGREMKTFTPKKYDKRCEYENLDMEYEVPDVRYDRVRSCFGHELPTTYITNNCQLNLTHAKVSVTTDYLDTKIPRDYENTYALNSDCSSPSAPRCEMMSERQAKRAPGNGGAPLTPKRGGGITAQSRPHIAIVEPSTTTPTTAVVVSPHSPASAHSSAMPRMMFRTDRLADTHPHAPNHDTCTFFDKHFDAKMVRERYARELEILREKLKDLHNHKYSPIKPPAVIKNLDRCPRRNTTNVNLEDIKVIEDVAVPKIDGIEKYKNVPAAASSELRKVAKGREQKSATKITVKTNKVRLPSARSSKMKLRSAKSTSFQQEEYSSSDHSDVDAPIITDKVTLKKGAVSPDLGIRQRPIVLNPESHSAEATPSREFGDAPIWPVRYSLFPNIPPYLKFSMHDDQPNKLPPAGRRYMKWKLSTITPIVVRKTLVNTGFRLVRIADDFQIDEKSKSPKQLLESNDWTGTWGKHMKSPMFRTLRNNQKLNHFAGTFQLGRKDRLWKNVQRLMHRFGNKEFGFIPQTFVLPHDLKALKQCWECKDGSAGEKWIIKPPASARGVGIKVINKWSQLPKQGSVVVQKYIADPYLINGSKFDLRLYVLVTSFNPLRIYLYPEGLVRFASVKYSDNDKDLKDRFMHLTNYSINKMSSQYTANEDANSCQGHKWTLTKLWEYLSDRGIDTKILWNGLKQLVIKTMISGESPITQLCNENVSNRYNCYELFGVDVLFDEKLKPWLLEVNISPSLHSTSPLDLHVKGPLVQTLFNLAQFHLPPKVGRSSEAAPPCYDPRIYTTTLTPKEANKHNYFMQIEKRSDYINEILDQLSGDDVRFLTQAEDEYVVKGHFERIFPTAHTHKFLEFIPVRYYNRLFDAWETRYERHREDGVQRLKALCSKRIHLKVQPPPVTAKNSQSTIPGTAANTTSIEGQVDHQQPIELSAQAISLPPSPNMKKTDVVTSGQK